MDREPPQFQNMFENMRRDVDPESLKKLFRFVVIVAVVFIVFLIGSASLVPTTEYLWFLHDARHPEVFRTGYETRGLLFCTTFVIGWLVLYANLRLAFNLTMVFLAAPSSRGQLLVTNAISFVQSRGAALVRLVAPVLAFFSALDFGNEWSTYLLARHAQTFGAKDPTYGLDLGFYVFTLPWLRAMTNYVCALLLLTTLSTIAVYAGLQAMAALAKIELGRPRVRAHVHILIGVTIFAFAVQLFLKTYEAGLVESGQFTGAGYAAMQGIAVQRVLAIFAVLIGAGTVLNGWLWRPYAVATRGAAAIAAMYVLGVLVWPAFIQKLYVDPDRIPKESPYAAKAIQMTRFGYGLDKIEIRDEVPSSEPTSAEVAASSNSFDNMRLWDPDVLRQCLEGYQAIRPYYKFYDVDIDRYMVAGKKTLLMLAPRQLDLGGLQPNARNWANERLQYTHGYGIVVTRVDRESSDGEPVMLDDDVPQKSEPDLAVSEPRLYYTSAHDDDTAPPKDEYAIVDTDQAELDYPKADTAVTTRWTGDGGIPIGGFLSKLIFSLRLGDGNLLVSPEIRSTSRLLMHRDITERATRIYPFLSFDGDPYIVILGGRLVWVMDGYTTTDMMPYSAFAGDVERINYIRNPVKVTIDAYTGVTTAYAIDGSEPILKAWMEVYPGLIHPASEVPAALAAHFRYPEDMLTVQSEQLCTYHVLDPQTLLNNNGAWTIASQRGLSGEKEPIRPFYVELKLPGDAGTSFVQILPFTPIGKINMSGWLAAHCDPDHYGQLTLYNLEQSNPIPGPEQMEGSFNTSPAISNINRQFNNEQSQIIVGNLLVVPVGSSFLYAESLFLKSTTQDIQAVPRLAKVILAFKDKVVVKDTYPEALQALLGTSQAPPAAQTQPPATSVPMAPSGKPGAVDVATVRSAVDLLDQADAALRQGDFARYGQLQKQVRTLLNGVLQPRK